MRREALAPDRTPSVHVSSSAQGAGRAAAEHIARVLRRRGPRRLVLAAGATMVPIYRELVRLHRAGRAPLSRCETWNVDELSVPPEDPRSFRAFMERELFAKVALPPGRIHFLRGDAPDLARECLRFEKGLDRAGGPDLALLGIGVNGHIAYLEPGQALSPRTSAVRLSAATRRRLAQGGMKLVPREALTMGIETIFSAREILLVASGAEKAAPLAAALNGPITPRLPASYLSVHPRLTVYADRKAAAQIL